MKSTIRVLAAVGVVWLLAMILACGTSGTETESTPAQAESSEPEGDPFGLTKALNNDLRRATEDMNRQTDQLNQGLQQASDQAEQTTGQVEDGLQQAAPAGAAPAAAAPAAQ